MKRYKVDYSDGALGDIEELAEYIAAESSKSISIRYIRTLTSACDSLATAPHRGTKRDELRPNMRIIGHKRAVTILFRIEEEKRLVVILGTAYGGRTIDRILERNE
jgi:plasmid stabilization system protein ParE